MTEYFDDMGNNVTAYVRSLERFKADALAVQPKEMPKAEVAFKEDVKAAKRTRRPDDYAMQPT